MGIPTRKDHDDSDRVATQLEARYPEFCEGAQPAEDWPEAKVEAWRDYDACDRVATAHEERKSINSPTLYRARQAARERLADGQ